MKILSLQKIWMVKRCSNCCHYSLAYSNFNLPSVKLTIFSSFPISARYLSIQSFLIPESPLNFIVNLKWPFFVDIIFSSFLFHIIFSNLSQFYLIIPQIIFFLLEKIHALTLHPHYIFILVIFVTFQLINLWFERVNEEISQTHNQ